MKAFIPARTREEDFCGFFCSCDQVGWFSVMRVWQSAIVSLLGHVGFFLIVLNAPLAIYKPPRCIEMRLISAEDFYPPANAGESGDGSAAAYVDKRSEDIARPAALQPALDNPVPLVKETSKVQPPHQVGDVNAKKRPCPPPKARTSNKKAGARPVAAPSRAPNPVSLTSPESSPYAETGSAAASAAAEGLPQGAASLGDGVGCAAGPWGLKSGAPGKGEGGVVEARFGAENGPRFQKQVKPEYPSIARQLGKEGTVLLRVTIDERGRAVEVEVMSKEGLGLEEEALRAVRASTFIPARSNGRPVKSRAILPVRFVLKRSG
ncbi:MAG: TonB family protein [Desulfobacteraceae bacterium]|nr:TonB family protein [Desulfobacteraceae bacterium]